ncbi:histidine phosphatase family protein [Paenibacillus glycinis]|uniref:Histidine phosphatase family protein n=1 Tax=Paenibacillus glycinis TaxID=2697035 RepID=A0ABW9XSR8_9BACL|nr:histidine phosphatase family protein [Paenibacillus glycinis]NBD25715.1 histidine phosphatase family protein [Paenibacillus glycinis]
MRIYIIRHADPDYERDTITAAGHLEAEALARRIAAERAARLYCSPLQRAQHTMAYTRTLTGLPCETQPWLSEIRGWDVPDNRGGTIAPWNVDGEIIRGAKPYPTRDTWTRMEPFSGEVFEQGFAELKRQSDAFMEASGYRREGGKYRILRENDDKLAVFCHMGFGLAWLAHLLEIPLPLVWSGFWLPPSSVTTILLDARSEEWAVPRCLGAGDVSHLYEAGLPVSRQGIIANFS